MISRPMDIDDYNMADRRPSYSVQASAGQPLFTQGPPVPTHTHAANIMPNNEACYPVILRPDESTHSIRALTQGTPCVLV